ncbi:nuclear transport factor 2 family protein [Actinomycetospora sp. NBC_00405]|uniref:nuclear transport factor 2 family protein n=1 Tax=Actinomycetospora sp. NBC_00405 TaxID=2975952 RepID=UPI002E1FD524
MTHDGTRPALDLATGRAEAESAAADLAMQLRDGLDAASADTYDAWFGADILWGSPYGATLAGFDELNAIHHQLMRRGTAPASRFEVVAVLAPAPGVAVAHIRRRARREGGFSEMAMYVLAKRDGEWWLAAAQNTPVAAA